jgi:hypothetical protein
MYKFGPRELLFWMMWLIIVVFAGANIANTVCKEAAEEQVAVLAERLKAKVHLDEYRTVVRSLDRCNERLRESEEYANANDYVIQQNDIVERFQPDTSEADDIEICNKCSANCEEALNWCYFWREEACLCLEEWEED